MMNIISSESYKILKSKIFYIISILLLGMNILSVAVTMYVQNSDSFSGDVESQMVSTGLDSYQASYSTSLIFYIILIFVASIITAEYSNGSIRQMASHGIPRWKLVVGQNIAISFIVTMMLITFGGLNLLSDTIITGLGKVDIGTFIRMNIGLICMFWAMAGIGTLLSYLFKNGGITIAASMLFITGSNIFLNLLALVTKNDIFIKYSFGNMRSIIVDFASKPEDVLQYSLVFLAIGVVTISVSSILFSKRDID